VALTSLCLDCSDDGLAYFRFTVKTNQVQSSLDVGTGNPYSGDVAGFIIGAGGALTAIPGSPFKAERYPTPLIVDPKAKFAYVADSIRNSISGYRIGANGALRQLTGSPFLVERRPLSIAIDPTGSLLVTP
jgi:DNA-binding beta-propeller fold protein YncE